MSIWNASNLLASTQIAGGSIVEGVEALWSWNGTDITQFGDGAGTPDYVVNGANGTFSVGAVPTSGVDVPTGNVLRYASGSATTGYAYFLINDLPPLPERYVIRARLGPRELPNTFPRIVCVAQDGTHNAIIGYGGSAGIYAVLDNNADSVSAAHYLLNSSLTDQEAGVVVEIEVIAGEPSSGVDPRINLILRDARGGLVAYGKGGPTWTVLGSPPAIYDSSWQSGGTIRRPGLAFYCNGSGGTDAWVGELQIFPHPSDFGTAQTVAVEGVESNLWAVPALSHAEDDEFDGDDLSGWTGVQNTTDGVAGSFSYGTVDPYDTSFNSGNVVRVNVNDAIRPSWALVQVPGSNKQFEIYKAISVPTNLLIWARIKFNSRATVVDNDSGCALAFVDSVGGVPTLNGKIRLFLNESDPGTIQAQSETISSGGAITGIVTTTDVDTQGQALEYVAIHKIGSTYHTWVGTSSGNWIWMNSYSGLDYTPDMVSIYGYNSSVSAPGAVVIGYDFVRFIETDKFLL